MAKCILLPVLLLLLDVVGVRAQTITTFEGIDASQVTAPEFDVDPNGAIGTKQYMEWVNPWYQAWGKTTFAPVWSKPQPGATPFTVNGNINCTNISGDGVIIFDRLASRWVIAAHNSGSTNYYYCVAVSNTDDLTSPTLAWYTYAIPLNKILGVNAEGATYFPDWPKIATWPDAYYIAMDLEDPNNGFQEVGVLVCALDRTNMLIGATANLPQCFDSPSPITGSMYLAHSFQPADVEGTTPPPPGAPEYYASIQNPVNDGVTTTSDTFNLWQFHVDWANRAASTFTQATVPVNAYTPGCYLASAPVNTICVPEATTSTTGQHIDSVGDRFMFRFAYRNFGTYQSYLVSHTVQVATGNGSQTGIRWYELRGNGVPALFQSGTISPDQSLYRFVPSIAQDQSGNTAVGYSVSSSSTHPSIRASWWSLATQTFPTEISLFDGTGDEENQPNWGDYTSMTVDPVGDCAFWYVNPYFSANQTGTPIWQTRISNFSLPTCGGVTLSPSPVTFGSRAVGTTSPAQKIILKNGQSSSLSINSIFGGGADPGDFTQTNNCGSSLAVGVSCTINVTFAPAAIGNRSATLSVSDDAANSPQTVALSGTGTAPVTLSSTSFNFGTVLIGSSKSANPITLTNHMAVALAGINVAVTGSAYTQTNTCGNTVPARGTCTIAVTFTPTSAGKQAGTVTITDSAVNSPQIISMTGSGRLPVTVLPLTLSFGTVKVGTTTAGKNVTVTNNLKTSLTISTISFTGADPADFAQTNTCGSSLIAGAQCTISVTFTPKATRARTATLSITDSASTSPQSVSLTGTGN
jgi:centrosomal CEP192-like protein/ASPM-SPD-2-Hydin domain-containing protein